ncbi:MAG: hypothetical protein RBU21_15565 [FCB group bacterium]|nr:hypothetical protein [FCB group bacterium]
MRRLVCVLIATMVCAWAGADELADAGRALLGKYEGALVTLQLTIKESYSAPDMGTEEMEYTMERPAVVVDPSGLAVTSLSMVDPTAAEEIPEEEGYKYTINVTSAKMIRSDGKEMVVKLALRDKDLDVAVFKPEAALPEPAVFVDMSTAVAPEALDPLLMLFRMDKVAGRAAGAGLARINAVPKKPRQYYVVGQADQMIGAAAFTAKGEPVGLVTLRWAQLGEDESMSLFGSGSMVELPIVLPAPDLMDVVKQAREAQPEVAAPAEAAPAAPAPAPAPASAP